MQVKGTQAGIILLGMACASWAEVDVTYAPTDIAPGAPTLLTISLTDRTGAGLQILGVTLIFEAPSQLTLSNFSWLSGLDGEGWYPEVRLRDGWAQTRPVGNARLDVIPSSTVDICTLTVTADPAAAGTVLTLMVFPEGSDAEIIHDTASFRPLEISTGRSVDLTVTSTNGDDSSGGGDSGDGGGTGGNTGGGDSDEGDQTDDATDGDAGDQDGSGPDDSDGDPDDNVTGDEDGPTNDNGSSIDHDDTVNDGDDGEHDGEPVDGGGDDQDSQGPGNDGDDDNTGPVNDPGPAPVRLCGLGMIPLGLFTLAGLSVMKLQGRRRRL